MKVAIVLNTSWNIYNFRRGLVEAILAEGHEVVAIAPKDEYVQHLLAIGCQYYPVQLNNKGTNPLQDVFYLHQLYRAYRKLKPDLVLQFTIKPNIYGTLAAALLGIPTINNVCGLGTVFLRDGFSSSVAKWLYKWAFRYPHKVFFQNEDDLQVFLEQKLISPELTALIPGSGLPLERFMPEPMPENEEFTFLMVARLIYDKGIVEYVEAARLLKAQGFRARFQLLGAIEEQKGLGISRGQLEAWVAEGLVEYLGTTDRVQQVIALADAVVLPSYREGTPRALLEAAGMAKPLITTNIAGCRQTVTDGYNGFLCEVKNVTDLAEKMQAMIQLSPEARATMGQNSRYKVEQEFDEKIVLNAYLRLVRNYAQSA
jgi:glycosyltransferase involved in cell wall biosynthesis